MLRLQRHFKIPLQMPRPYLFLLRIDDWAFVFRFQCFSTTRNQFRWNTYQDSYTSNGANLQHQHITYSPLHTNIFKMQFSTSLLSLAPIVGLVLAAPSLSSRQEASTIYACTDSTFPEGDPCPYGISQGSGFCAALSVVPGVCCKYFCPT